MSITARTDDPESPRTRLMGVAIDCLSEAETVDLLASRKHGGEGSFVVTVNLDHLRRCRRDESYQKLVEEADLVVADGMPLVWASRLQGGTQIPERVAGSTMMFSLCERAAAEGFSIFLLGGHPEDVAAKAAVALQQRYTGLKIAGKFCPPFGFEKDPKQLAAIKAMLQAAKPDLVLVALGSPKQELLIRDIRGALPVAIWIGIGISLSFATGEVQRAPALLQRMGLEWAHRLIQEPRRLFRRYIIDGIPFAMQLFAHSIRRRFS